MSRKTQLTRSRIRPNSFVIIFDEAGLAEKLEAMIEVFTPTRDGLLGKLGQQGCEDRPEAVARFSSRERRIGGSCRNDQGGDQPD